MKKLKCGRFELDLSVPKVMGIVNVTPDSFSDGGQYHGVEHALRLIEEGADILDIGGESTRPGADPVSVQEELDRVMPVLEAVKNAGVPVSIDTLKTPVMKEVLEAGADMINDVFALRDEGAVALLAQYPDKGIGLMHMAGHPKTMQDKLPDYQPNVTLSVAKFLEERVNALLKQGIDKNRICIDPGFCFGKSLKDNYDLLAHLAYFQYLECPILVGVSRKSMIGQVLNLPPQERVFGTISAGLFSIIQGANILRVHDVKAHVQALKIWQTIEERKNNEP
ncbi:dihydropteroate synthase [Basilea psittacipulmonis]|uniref:Dihydropteroate synthase n=1 Tax=Basilea psittacipulmonis DSM 24701 TaxID=1072685 RepID=A0A077DIF5_9BURK|nr:dihydropteroate synthase [Basilea psittacipulmonis]AIL32953.1 dihydropteroate synthase [Basilea psittacipulmonis DSM 24701]